MLAAVAKPFVNYPLLFPPALGTGAKKKWNKSMAKNNLSTHRFQRKISDFCEVRLAPIASKRMLECIRPYLISLVVHRQPPPIANGRIDWTIIGQACGIEGELTAELKKG